MKPSAFLTALQRQAGTRSTVTGADALNCFLRLHPHMDGENARSAFMEALEALRPDYLVMPVAANHWDKAALPAIPKWFRLKRETRKHSPSFDHRSHPWSAPLKFVASLRRVILANEVQFIDQWIRRMPSDEPWVPAKERSWEIFGDEKRLEQLANGALFGENRLSLKDLRCYVVPCTPVHRIFPSPNSRLIISENEAGFDSLCRAAREFGSFRCVVFGDGNQIEKASEFLIASAQEHHTDEWLYVGDLDTAAVAIPNRLAKKLSGGGVRLSPWAPYYDHVLADTPFAEGITNEISWLPLSTAGRAKSLIAQGRVAQESVGWKVLYRLLQNEPTEGKRPPASSPSHGEI